MAASVAFASNTKDDSGAIGTVDGSSVAEHRDSRAMLEAAGGFESLLTAIDSTGLVARNGGLHFTDDILTARRSR